MRVVFMGTPSFAVPSLDALCASHEVACVFTRPDQPAGRGREPRPSAVKAAALAAGLAVEQPAALDADAERRLRELRPDVVVVVAYGMILREGALTAPLLGCVNVHASLLPRWRGAAPIQRAILAGDEVTGVSIMRMERGLDTGPWATQVSVPVAGRSTDELGETLSIAGAEALIEVLATMASGTVTWTPQDDAHATYADKVVSADVSLDPSLDAVALERRVRASGASAPSRALIAGRPVVVTAATATDVTIRPGAVAVHDGRLLLGATGGALAADAVTPAGKRSMAGADFARGARFDASATWTAPA
jgi:methionyl-tRNA formyltransferase